MSQTVNFTQPDVINNLQTSMSTVQQSVGTDPEPFPMDAASWANYSTYLNSQLAVTKGNGRATNTTGAPTLARDLYGTGAFGVCSIFGNVFTGQEMTIATGAQDISGTPINPDSIINVGSNAKMLGYLTVVKMLQEQYFTITETISRYVPQFTGFGWAWSNATGTASTSYIDDPINNSSWFFTGTLNRVTLTTLTIGQAMGMQIHFPYISTSVAAPSGKQSSLTNANTSSDWGVIYSGYLAQQALETGLALGATGACQLYTPASGTGSASFVRGTGALRNYTHNFMFNDTSVCTGYYTDMLNTSINCIRSGVVPMGFVPGIDVESQQGIYGPKAIYNFFSPLLLQAVCSRALQSKQGTTGFPSAGTYPTLISYIRAKILAPCDITPADSFFGACEGPAAVTAPSITVPWRRAYVMSTGWYASTTNADPTYLPQAAALVWPSQYPNDGLSLRSSLTRSVVNNDPLAPDFGGNFFITARKYLNLVKMIINKGTYNSNRILSRSFWNYITNGSVSLGINVFEVGSGLADNIGPTANFTLLNTARSNPAFTNINEPIVNNVSSTGTVGETTAQTVTGNSLAVGQTPFSHFWTGSQGTMCVFDTDSGNYMFWMLPQNSAGVAVNTVSAYTNFVTVQRWI